MNLCAESICPLETGKDLEMLIDIVDCYYKLPRIYATSNSPTSDDEKWDFSFTQMAIDDRIARIKDIRVETEETEENMNEVIEEAEEEERLSFHGDSSNMDSSESDCPKPEKNKARRVPPPNPPYRSRRRG